jgi:hypothetical protein
MRQIVVTLGPLTAASANAICLSQTPLAAGSLTINGALASGGAATLDVARRVLITSAANDSARSFVVTGTDYSGGVISETVTPGPNPSVFTNLDFKTVTSITVDAATAGAITVGTNGVASSQPIPLDIHGRPEVSLQVAVTGTVNYTLSQSLDNPWTNTNPNTWTWLAHPDANLVAATASKQGNYAYVPAMTRITLNSGTGSVKYTIVQSGDNRA